MINRLVAIWIGVLISIFALFMLHGNAGDEFALRISDKDGRPAEDAQFILVELIKLDMDPSNVVQCSGNIHMVRSQDIETNGKGLLE